MKKKRILAFIMIFLIALTTLSTTVFGFNSYEEYFNGKYSYSLKIPKDKKNVIMETNQSSVLIPYSEQIRLEINVEDVSTLLTNKEQENYNERDLEKLTLKSDVFENTYASEAYMQKNAVKLIKKFAPSPTLTSIESFKMDRRNAFKIFYNTKITGADNKAATGHGLILFTIDGGRVYYFVFTDNSLKQANITDYDFIDKAISTVNLEDFDYTPFILIGILCILLYVLLMSLYLKAERRAEERRERKRREKELKRRRALGIEPISQDEDYEYYDEIVLEEADESEEVDGESVFTVEQIMKLYPSLKDIKIRPRSDGKDQIETPETENKNIIDYKEIEEDLDKKIKADEDRKSKENEIKEEKDTAEEIEAKEENFEESKSAEVGDGLAAMTPVSKSEGFYELREEDDKLKEEIGFELAGRREKGDKLSVKNDNIYDDDGEGFVFEDISEEDIGNKNDNLDLSFREEYQSPEDSINMADFGKEIDDDSVSDLDYSFEDEADGDIPMDEVNIDQSDIVDNSEIGDELFEDILKDTELDTMNNEYMTDEAENKVNIDDDEMEPAKAEDIAENSLVNTDNTDEDIYSSDDDLEEDFKDKLSENGEADLNKSDNDIDDVSVSDESDADEVVSDEVVDESISKDEEINSETFNDTEDDKAEVFENTDTAKTEEEPLDNKSSEEDVNTDNEEILEDINNEEETADEDGFEGIYEEVLKSEETLNNEDMKDINDNSIEDEFSEETEETVSEDDIYSIISEIDEEIDRKETDIVLDDIESGIETQSSEDTSAENDLEDKEVSVNKSEEENREQETKGDMIKDFKDNEIDEVLISNDKKEVTDEFSQMVDFLDGEE